MAEPEDTTATAEDKKRPAPKASQFAVLLGVGFAVVTIVSGIIGFLQVPVFGWHHPTGVTREVFVNVPLSVQIVFYLILSAGFVWVGLEFAKRFRNYERGAPDNRATTAKNAKRRITDFRAGVFMHTLLRDGAAGVMHSLIYFPFLGLFAVTSLLELDHQLPPGLKFLHGNTYLAYSAFGDACGVLFTIGIVWAFLRRYGLTWRIVAGTVALIAMAASSTAVIVHGIYMYAIVMGSIGLAALVLTLVLPKRAYLIPAIYRIRIKARPEDAVILGVLGYIGISGLLTEAARIAVVGRPSFEQWSFIGYPLSFMFPVGSHGVPVPVTSAFHMGLWVSHVVAFIGLLIILPITKLRHMFTSPMNMYLKDRERPKGAMKAMPDLMETELEDFGAHLIPEFTWKQLLDTDACTVCGRCTSVCPAHATGKPLDPREIVLKVGHVMSATAPNGPVPPTVGQDTEITVKSENVFERITPEEIWSCTTCKACDEICPVNIEILDKILDMRRYLALMESEFPSELGRMYNSMENQENPWGLSNTERADWAKGLDIDVPIVDESKGLDHEYLFWVGCAGSFDDRAKKVTQAMSKLLTRAGVDFAILGPSERCTGDPARRSGNEYIFQMLASQNVEFFAELGVKKIITICPHCFNIIKNEYPQLGGEYEVVHHAQLLEHLIASGKLDLSDASLEERIVYHDSCYLSRHNDVYAAPRNVIGSLKGIDIVEAPRNGTKGMCCGAGGARMFMEESTGTKVNTERSRELIATGASRIATACPFCYVMIDDGVKENRADEQVQVKDISMHLLEAIEKGRSAQVAVPVGAVSDAGVSSETTSTAVSD